MLKMVRTTASMRAKVAYGPVPSTIGSGPKINTAPKETGVPCKKVDITMKMTPIRINRKLRKKSLNRKDDWSISDSPDSLSRT